MLAYGDGNGFQSGYLYSEELNTSESQPVAGDVCPSDHGSLQSGDTIEIHYVYSSAQVEPGETLGSCLSESIKNPQLSVEVQVFILANDGDARDFSKRAEVTKKDDLHQALNIPGNTGTPIIYEGSTTGPGYNEASSPFQAPWGVRPDVAKVNVETVGEWCKGNVFNEDHAHGVKNLVINPDLLSPI